MTIPKHNPRVLAALREDGWYAESVDHWDSFTRRTKDLFGCIDVLALSCAGTLAVQVTSRGNMASRRTKIREAEAFPEMMAAGWAVQVWGYDQPGGKGTHWQLKVEEITMTDTWVVSDG